MDPVTLARLWMVVPEVVKIIRKDGTEHTRTEPLIPARTTTKQGVVGYLAVLPITQALQAVDFPWPWLNQLLDNDMFVQAITIGVLVIWGRWFKSPIATQAI